jgi:SAM-dependent methyltransferase
MRTKLAPVSTCLIRTCLCGSGQFRELSMHQLTMRRCLKCDVIHQAVNMTLLEYKEWYASGYHQNVYTHSYKEDLEVGRLRIKVYGPRYRSKALDIGTAFGGFLDAAHEAGFDAVGQDIVDNGRPDTLIGTVESLHFQPQSFATITLHDVLEHVVGVRELLDELFGILKPGGRIIVDFPNFWVPEGKHHWRPIQHLWMFTEKQLVEVLMQVGLVIECIEYPIPSKVVFYARKD